MHSTDPTPNDPIIRIADVDFAYNGQRVLEEVNLEEASVPVAPGDLLVLFTDGITDASSPTGEFSGIDLLRETVLAARSMDAQGLCDLVFARLDQFQAGAVQFDDMALLVAGKRIGG